MEEENVTSANRNLARTQTYDLPKNEGRIGYKKTKFGWIPEEWEDVVLNDCKANEKWSITGGPFGSNLKVSDYVNSGVKIIQLQDIGDGIFINSSNIRTTLEKANELISCNIYPGDIIISKMGDPVARACVIPDNEERYVMASDGIRLKVEDLEWNKNYVFYLINSTEVRRIAERWSIGSTRKRISLNDLKSLPICKPKKDEQTAIATCLSTWDSAIATLTQLIEKKQQAKKGLMQQLLSGKKRLAGFDGEWETKPLSNFIKYTPREADKPNGTFHKLGIRSHCKGTFLNEDFDSEKIAIDKMYVVEENDLIVNITFAWEGAIAIINKEHAKTYVSHRFPTYTFKKDVGSPEYFKQFIQSKKFRYLLELISPGGAGRNRVMSKKDFLKLKITVPNYDEQTAIAQVLQTADDEIGLLTQKLERLKEQKKGLMQVLLTGRKRLEY